MAEITPQEQPEQEQPEREQAEPGQTETGRPPLLAILLLIVALGLALYIGTNVLSVLFAVISPPLPPIPPNLTQTSHSSEAYGVDKWKYVSTGDACTLVKYVQDNGGDCKIVPLGCTENRYIDPNATLQTSIVARCSGQMSFSIFNEQWRSIISYLTDGTPQIEIDREVYWIGTGPQ